MGNVVSLNSSEAIKVVRELTECCERLGKACSNYRGDLIQAYDRDALDFYKGMSITVEKLNDNFKKTKELCTELEEGLVKFANTMNEFEQDEM